MPWVESTDAVSRLTAQVWEKLGNQVGCSQGVVISPSLTSLLRYGVEQYYAI